MIYRLVFVATCVAAIFIIRGCQDRRDARADGEWRDWQRKSAVVEVSRVANPE